MVTLCTISLQGVRALVLETTTPWPLMYVGYLQFYSSMSECYKAVCQLIFHVITFRLLRNSLTAKVDNPLLDM